MFIRCTTIKSHITLYITLLNNHYTVFTYSWIYLDFIDKKFDDALKIYTFPPVVIKIIMLSKTGNEELFFVVFVSFSIILIGNNIWISPQHFSWKLFLVIMFKNWSSFEFVVKVKDTWRIRLEALFSNIRIYLLYFSAGIHILSCQQQFKHLSTPFICVFTFIVGNAKYYANGKTHSRVNNLSKWIFNFYSKCKYTICNNFLILRTIFFRNDISYSI